MATVVVGMWMLLSAAAVVVYALGNGKTVGDWSEGRRERQTVGLRESGWWMDASVVLEVCDRQVRLARWVPIVQTSSARCMSRLGGGGTGCARGCGCGCGCGWAAAAPRPQSRWRAGEEAKNESAQTALAGRYRPLSITRKRRHTHHTSRPKHRELTEYRNTTAPELALRYRLGVGIFAPTQIIPRVFPVHHYPPALCLSELGATRSRLFACLFACLLACLLACACVRRWAMMADIRETVNTILSHNTRQMLRACRDGREDRVGAYLACEYDSNCHDLRLNTPLHKVRVRRACRGGTLDVGGRLLMS